MLSALWTLDFLMIWPDLCHAKMQDCHGVGSCSIISVALFSSNLMWSVLILLALDSRYSQEGIPLPTTIPARSSISISAGIRSFKFALPCLPKAKCKNCQRGNGTGSHLPNLRRTLTKSIAFQNREGHPHLPSAWRPRWPEGLLQALCCGSGSCGFNRVAPLDFQPQKP